MKIDIPKLRKNPVVYNVEFGPEYLGGGSEEDVRFSSGHGQVVFRLVGDDVLAEGSLRSQVCGRCARCLREVTVPVEATVRLFYWPKKEETGSKIVDIDPEEPDFGVYEGDAIDPDGDLRELLVVETPQVFLCREECKGLCARCGADLNDETPHRCRAEEKEEESEQPAAAEPSWKAKLRSLRSLPKA